jgi:tripartite-type tricarboxylate transporter receptor subunit TctC
MKIIGKSLLASLAFAGVLAQAQAAYPDHPLRVIVPFTPGGASDGAMRLVAQKMSEELKQPIVIENRPGVPGIQAAATAVPDGYTFLLGSGSAIVTDPLMHPRLVYNPARDFVPVGGLVFNVPVLVAYPSLGVKTVQQLVDRAHRTPGRLNYVSSGVGNPSHLAMELFQQLTKTEMVHIPYKGGSQSLTEMLGGYVHVGVYAVPSVFSYLKGGRLVPLAVASAKRLPSLPDVPTFTEAGVPLKYEIWYALFAPTKTPPEAVAKFGAALRHALADPAIARRLRDEGAEPAPSTPEELAAYVKEDTAIWSRLIRERKLKLD